MNKSILTGVVIIGGLAFFFVMTMFAISLGQYNARTTPNLPWFPIVVLGVLFSLVFWINSKWDIGLALPEGKPWGRIAAFMVLITIACRCVSTFEGAFHDVTREFEVGPAGVSPLFAFVYWIGIVIAISTASEVAFRGIMQSKLTPLFGIWPVILIVSFINTVSHRWDGLAERAVGTFTILVATGYLRHLSGSVTPAILAHIATIFVWDIILWTWGPWDLGAIGWGTLVATAFIGTITFAASFYLAKQIKTVS